MTHHDEVFDPDDSSSDLDSWLELTKSVQPRRPLKHYQPPILQSKPRLFPTQSSNNATYSITSSPSPSSPLPPSSPPPFYGSADRNASTPNISRTVIRKLANGHIQCDMRIDLHGYTKKEAWQILIRLIPKAYHQQQRYLLIITGKGKRSTQHPVDFDSEPQTLQRLLPQWIKEEELRHYIHSISQASAQHGGNGAYYLILKNYRP
jgi:DNA-nicking Smr family endonuclease